MLSVIEKIQENRERRLKEEREYKVFRENWSMDVLNSCITHKSGLTITAIDDIPLPKDKIRLRYDGMVPWEQKLRKEGKTEKETNDYKLKLCNEFYKIYKKEMPKWKRVKRRYSANDGEIQEKRKLFRKENRKGLGNRRDYTIAIENIDGYEEFRNDWKINRKRREITHKSGLTIASFDDISIPKGTKTLSYDNIAIWEDKLRKENKTEDEIKALRKSLSQECIKIWRKEMPKFKYKGPDFSWLEEQLAEKEKRDAAEAKKKNIQKNKGSYFARKMKTMFGKGKEK